MFKFLLRTVLVALALTYAIPLITGAQFHGDWIALGTTSLVFNALFLGIEWLLGAIVLGINISTLGLGVIITSGLRFFANMLAPSVALYGTAKIMPRFIEVANYYPVSIVAGLMLGGILWSSAPQAKKGK